MNPIQRAELFIKHMEESILRALALDPAEYCLGRSDSEVILCKFEIAPDGESLKILPAAFHTFFNGNTPKVQDFRPFFGFDHKKAVDAFDTIYPSVFGVELKDRLEKVTREHR